MTLVACVNDDAEAVRAFAAGFDGVARDQGDGTVAVTLRSGRRLVLQPVDPSGAARDGLPMPRPDQDGLLLRSGGRLPEAVSFLALARLTAQAADKSVLLALAGALEAPDVPRLAAAGAAMQLVGRGLREGGSLDARRMAAVTGRTPNAPAPATGHPRDRIFVRDLLLAMEVGAYASERGRRQRVRVSVEAEVDPAGRDAAVMADVVSYDLIVDAVERLAATGHIELVETFAEAVAAALLGVGRVAVVRVRVEKLDLGPGAVGVEIERRRPDTAAA